MSGPGLGPKMIPQAAEEPSQRRGQDKIKAQRRTRGNLPPSSHVGRGPPACAAGENEGELNPLNPWTPLQSWLPSLLHRPHFLFLEEVSLSFLSFGGFPSFPPPSLSVISSNISFCFV